MIKVENDEKPQPNIFNLFISEYTFSGHWKAAVHNIAEYYQVIFCDGHVEYLHGGIIDPEKMDR